MNFEIHVAFFVSCCSLTRLVHWLGLVHWFGVGRIMWSVVWSSIWSGIWRGVWSSIWGGTTVVVVASGMIIVAFGITLSINKVKKYNIE
jgi:hypothetical protein